MSDRTSDLYEFGPYRLDVAGRALVRQGEAVALPPKTFDLLLLLVQSPGRAFSKQDLMTALWPDTFVEEANLSFQISTLRKALGNGAAEWIETVPKHGYRFAADVKRIPARRGTARGRVAAITAAIALGAVPSLLFLRGRRTEAPSPPSAIAVPLTAYQGFENTPSLSPDGSQVAFSWNGPAEDNYDIYVKLVGPGQPLRVTSNAARDDNPAWSPDGRLIAFQRFISDEAADVYVMPALGGAERKVAEGLPAASRVGGSLSAIASLAWSPDGKWLACGGQPFQKEDEGIWLLLVDGSERRRLTEVSDLSPSFSPDGRRLAFIRKDRAWGVYVLPLTSGLMPAGPARRVTPEGTRARGLAWTPDGRGIVYSSSGALGLARLVRVALAPATDAPGVPEPLPFGEQSMALTISRTGRLVYSLQSRDTGFWKLAITPPNRSAAGPVAPSTFDEHTPDYSPDGKRLAFASSRSGTEEIWISDADGANPVQMTTMGGPPCSNPRWSPDGRTILMQSRREGSADLYLLRPDSGELRRLTDHPAGEFLPRWSRDGRTIYFGSDRTGRREVWKMPAAGGPPTRITRQGGLAAIESPDRRFLYYAKGAASPTSIWRVAAEGGEETPVVDGLSDSLNFAVADRGLYFLAVGDAPDKTSIDFLEYATEKRTTLLTVGKQWWYGVALSPDQRSLLFSTVDSAGSNLMVVDKLE